MHRIGFSLLLTFGLLLGAQAAPMPNDVLAGSAITASGVAIPTAKPISLPSKAERAVRNSLQGTGRAYPKHWQALPGNRNYSSYQAQGPNAIRVDVPRNGFLCRVTIPVGRFKHAAFQAEQLTVTAVWDDLKRLLQQRHWRMENFTSKNNLFHASAKNAHLIESQTVHGAMLEKAKGRRRFQKLNMTKLTLSSGDLTLTTPRWSLSSLQQLDLKTSKPLTTTIRMSGEAATLSYHGNTLAEINGLDWHNHHLEALLLGRMNAQLKWPHLIGLPTEIGATLRIRKPKHLVEIMHRAATMPSQQPLHNLTPVQVPSPAMPLETWIKELGLSANLEIRLTAPAWFGQVQVSLGADQAPNDVKNADRPAQREVISVSTTVQITDQQAFANDLSAKVIAHLQRLAPAKALPMQAALRQRNP